MTKVTARPTPWVAATLLLSAVGLAAGAGAPSGNAARQFLTTRLGLSQADLARLDKGLVVTRALDASDRREVAVLGAVRIRVSPHTYITRLRDIVAFKRHEAVLEIGVFGDPPTASDMAGMTLERGDLRDLRGCRVGNCDWKLPAATISRLRAEVPWGTPEADRRAHAVIREDLARYVADYRVRGDAAGMQYDSARTPVRVGEEFRALLDSDQDVLEHFPALVEHARSYPRGAPPAAESLIYWSREKPGPSPVLSITHMIFTAGGTGSPVAHAVMSRQIYGSKYFDASKGLTLVLPDGDAAAPASLVVYINRSRLDVFDGLLGGVIRRTVRSRVRSGMGESLARVRVAMERAGEARHPSHSSYRSGV